MSIAFVNGLARSQTPISGPKAFDLVTAKREGPLS